MNMLIEKETGRILEIEENFIETKKHYGLNNTYYMKNQVELVENIDLPDFVKKRIYTYKNDEFIEIPVQEVTDEQ